jgi:hypothetical protein
MADTETAQDGTELTPEQKEAREQAQAALAEKDRAAGEQAAEQAAADKPQPEHPVDGTPELGAEVVNVSGADVGVKALPSDGNERQGPEDALGHGPKRGDYRNRQPEDTLHTRQVEIPESELLRDEAGGIIDGQPRTRTEVQNDHVHNIGDVPGKKGGVDTALQDIPAS